MSVIVEIFRAFLISIVAALCVACARPIAHIPTADSMIRGGPNEPTFDQRYGIELELPMPEDEFRRLMAGIPLEVRLLGQRGPDYRPLPPAAHFQSFDVSNVDYGWLIIGGFNQDAVRMELYCAYVKDGKVVYLENQFQY